MRAAPDTSLQVPRLLTIIGHYIARNPDLWMKIGNFESKLLTEDLAAIVVSKPIYVCGLARSGSTLLLEILASQADTASHRYQDFPFVFTPFWWHTALAFNRFRDNTLRERAHGDKMLVNSQSPEAMEEMLWMAFFPNIHDAAAKQVLDNATAHAGFEHFYPNHVRKLLLTQKRKRYLSKGNYNITRMLYLQKLFPDARFIIPVRSPETHIASLMRQHQRFSEAGRNDADVVKHMSIAGHYEFGLDRRPIHAGDSARMDAIQAAWKAGDEVRGWALYWDMLYRFVHNQLQDNPALAKAALVVPFEKMYGHPQATIAEIFQHCDLPDGTKLAGEFSARIQKPEYYSHAFNDAEKALITDITQETAALFGY
jgi:hypothetical protein